MLNILVGTAAALFILRTLAQMLVRWHVRQQQQAKMDKLLTLQAALRAQVEQD